MNLQAKNVGSCGLHVMTFLGWFQSLNACAVSGCQVDVGPAHCKCTILQSTSRVVVTAIASHEAALAARTRGPVGTFNLLVAGPHADIWQGCSGQVRTQRSAPCVHGLLCSWPAVGL